MSIEDRVRTSLARQASSVRESEEAWEEIRRRVGQSARRARSERVVAAAVALTLTAAGLGLAAWALRLGARRSPAGPPAEERIAFLRYVRTPGGGNADLVWISPNREGPVRVLAMNVDPSLAPAWSPDGATAAFFGNASAPGLRVVDADGSHLRRLVACPSNTCRPGDLAWSPDGTRIAFIRNFNVADRSGSSCCGITPASSLEVVSVRGGAPQILCAFPRCGQGLAQVTWAPDGSRILFSQAGKELFPTLGSPTSSLYVVNPDGTGLRQLTNITCHPSTTECSTDLNPAWSPDGRRIAFLRNLIPPHTIGSNTWEVEVMSSDGTGARTLFTCQDPPCRPVVGPAWSPDGLSLAYTRVGEGAIFVVAASGGTTQRIPTCTPVGCVGANDLAWSRGGKAFAFVATTILYDIHSDGTGIRRLADGVACCPTFLPAKSSP